MPANASEEMNVTDFVQSFPSKLISRRALLAASVAGIAIGAGFLPALAQQKKGPAEVSVGELMQPGPLPDQVLGKADAPVTIVEYASMTCGHCASFHTAVLPTLKQKYIDTGKVKLILREFPLDNLAAAASMLTRCTTPEKSYELTAKLFAEQEAWAYVRSNAVPALFKIAESAGFTKDSFDKCLKDDKLLEGITNTRDRANKSFGVSATPTFFINGRKLETASDRIESFDQAIEPLLKK